MTKLLAHAFVLVSLSILLFPLPLAAQNTQPQQCDRNRVSLEVLGSGGPELDDGRNSSGYIVWVDNQSKVIIDAGAGTSVAFGKAGGKFEHVSAILLTHLHVDHSLDLPAYIKGSFFTPRRQDLIVAGPAKNKLMPSTSEYVQRLLGQSGAFHYLKEYADAGSQSDYKIVAIDIDATVSAQPNPLTINEQITASAITVHHGPIAAIAWKIQVMGCTLVFSGDMSNDRDVLASFAHSADLLIANNAVPEMAGEVAKNLHMTPIEIGKIAQLTQTKKLLLSHFMNRTLTTQDASVKQVRKHYSGPIVLAEDGMTVRLD